MTIGVAKVRLLRVGIVIKRSIVAGSYLDQHFMEKLMLLTATASDAKRGEKGSLKEILFFVILKMAPFPQKKVFK